MAVVALLLVATFYGGTHIRNRFSSKHSGQDIGGWRAGTSIPSPVAGTVAGFGWHRNYGYWVSIRLASGWYVTFSHMLRATPLKRGASVVVGTLVGQVGASGAFAVGFHVHVGYGRGMYPWSRPTSDPLPIIRKGTQPAAVVVAPIPPPLPELGDKNMLILKPTDSKTGFPNAPVARILTDLRHKEIVTNKARIAAIDFASTRTDGPPTLIFDKANWDAFAALSDFPTPATVAITDEQMSAISAGVKVDLSAVLDAIRQVPTTILNLFKQQWAKS